MLSRKAPLQPHPAEGQDVRQSVIKALAQASREAQGMRSRLFSGQVSLPPSAGCLAHLLPCLTRLETLRCVQGWSLGPLHTLLVPRYTRLAPSANLEGNSILENHLEGKNGPQTFLGSRKFRITGVLVLLQSS